MIDGTLRIDAAIASTFRGRGSSVIKAVIATGCTTCRARATRSGRSSGHVRDWMQRDETAGDERADRDRDARHGRRATEAEVFHGVRVGGQGRVDEPRLERSRIECPEDALQHHRGDEQGRRVCEGEQRIDTIGTPTRKQHRSASEGVDNPPVGSSKASTTRPCAAKTTPISVSDSPRDSGRARDRDQEADRQPAQRDEGEESSPERAASWSAVMPSPPGRRRRRPPGTCGNRRRRHQRENHRGMVRESGLEVRQKLRLRIRGVARARHGLRRRHSPRRHATRAAHPGRRRGSARIAQRSRGSMPPEPVRLAASASGSPARTRSRHSWLAVLAHHQRSRPRPSSVSSTRPTDGSLRR